MMLSFDTREYIACGEEMESDLCGDRCVHAYAWTCVLVLKCVERLDDFIVIALNDVREKCYCCDINSIQTSQIKSGEVNLISRT